MPLVFVTIAEARTLDSSGMVREQGNLVVLSAFGRLIREWDLRGNESFKPSTLRFLLL